MRTGVHSSYQVLPVLQVQGLQVCCGDQSLISGFSLSLGCGDLLHLTGPNGSGKSTVLRVLAGLASRRRGSIVYGGEIGYVGHQEGLYGGLSVLEHLQYWGVATADTVAQVFACLRLSAHADPQVRTLSVGQRRRLALLRLVFGRFCVWFLDEPDMGLDAAGVEWLSALLTSQIASGSMALVYVSHRLSVPKGGCSRIEFSLQTGWVKRAASS